MINTPEEFCDGDEYRGEGTCRSYDFVRGALSCDESCRVSTENCESGLPPGTDPVCGNGILEPGEECDIDPPTGGDCEDLDLGMGDTTCSAFCTIDTSNCNDSGSSPICGDGQCSATESCGGCPEDCGSCTDICGDGQCTAGESCELCPFDCGTCDSCGNDQCDAGESCNTCTIDCGQCEHCGDGLCNLGETCDSCAQDCGSCCGDGVCNFGESCSSCQQDCGSCCGDGLCNFGESCSGCQQDCGSCCGDGSCNFGETCNSCQQDCGACPCPAANYWSPTSDLSSDSLGDEDDGQIEVEIEVEVRQAGQGLEFRVCKPGDIFQENIAFYIYDDNGNGAYAEVGDLGTQDSSCSVWVGMSNDNGYTEGETFNGRWQLVSPESVAGQWSFPDNGCAVAPGVQGACWTGSNVILTRTCL
ncbi:MAG: hypothetical protein AAF799_39490 [Myxococcota bacterium]